jgi:hypothetical protein
MFWKKQRNMEFIIELQHSLFIKCKCRLSGHCFWGRGRVFCSFRGGAAEFLKLTCTPGKPHLPGGSELIRLAGPPLSTRPGSNLSTVKKKMRSLPSWQQGQPSKSSPLMKPPACLEIIGAGLIQPPFSMSFRMEKLRLQLHFSEGGALSDYLLGL